MTSSRVVRGTKGRIIFCVCAIFIIVAIVACYNNTLSQLEDVRKTSDQCHQQQENLSTQLQVIFDYKQRLEKSLKSEKAEHQQTKKILEAKLEEEHSKNEKTVNESNLKLSSLQQHFNLLKTQHGDFKEECSKTQQQQLDEINILQAKLKELQGQLKQSITDKDNSFEHLKSQYMQLQVEKENLEQQLQNGQNKDLHTDSDINHLTKVNHELQRELDILKAKCSTFIKPEVPSGPQNQIGPPANASTHADEAVKEQFVDNRNVADLPPNIEEAHKNANELPFVNNNVNVLSPPSVNILPGNQKTSTTEKNSMNVISPLHIPLVTLKNSEPSEGMIENQHKNVLPIPHIVNSGAVEVPQQPIPLLEKQETANKAKSIHNADENYVREDVNNAYPNRYRTKLILGEIDAAAKVKKEDKEQKIKDDTVKVIDNQNLKENKNKLEPVEADNGAFEEGDQPVANQGPVVAKHGNDYDNDIQNGALENDPEAEDDDPDYADNIVLSRQKDLAIRN